MFAEIIEYENILDRITTTTTLSENQIDTLINIITENPTLTPNALFDIATNLNNGEKIIMDGHKDYAFDPILNENKETNLLEITLPIIKKHIPKNFMVSLNENHARAIVDKILNIEINENETSETLSQRIDEMFTSGAITIPIQGLRPEPTTVEIVTNGVFAPMLYKNIQFDKKFHKKNSSNKLTLKDALKGYKMIDNNETPLSMMLPKILVTLKQLLNKKVN